MTVQFRYAARSDVGLVRSNNQDSGYAGPHLLVLADGMGGPAGGDVASSVAVAHLAPLDDDVPPAEQLLPLLRGAIEHGGRDDFAAVLAAIQDSGALAETLRYAQEEAKRAIEAISVLPPSNFKDALLQLSDFAVRRKH